MDAQKQQIAERIKQSNNILVTVSNNPSVDQLAACIGITLALNKMGKHATAVFSGNVPSTLQFLQPEKTIEKNTDSLRDFIISLDKAKADKLRYKVEDKVVKIFITPYRTSITDKDLNFSQGDFNVDVVLALGVHAQADLDQAITSHGRILHDATVITMNVRPGGELGAINWLDAGASSLSELVVQLSDLLDRNLMDGQIATAMLTGIVAETDRFSNAKTSPQTMSISAELMSAGANQQLVATKLEEPIVVPAAPLVGTQNMPAANGTQAPVSQDGTLEITHDKNAMPPAPSDESHESIAPEIHIDDQGSLVPMGGGPLDLDTPKTEKKDNDEKHSFSRHHLEPPKMITQPPTMGGQLTANSSQDLLGVPTESLTLPALDTPLLSHDPIGTRSKAPTMQPLTQEESLQPISEGQTLPPIEPDLTLPSVTPIAPAPEEKSSTGFDTQTLSDIEKTLHSDHLQEVVPAAPGMATIPTLEVQVPSLDSARNAVDAAMVDSPQPLQPIQALNAHPLDLPAFDGPAQTGTVAPAGIAQDQTSDPNAPPPVPPPMLPPVQQ